MSGPCYVLCSVPAPTVKEASSGRRSPAVWERASSGHMGSTLGRRARESRKATWEKAAGQPEPQSHLGEERPEAVKSGLEITASRLLSCPARGSAGRQARPRSALHWRGSPREWHSLSNLSFFVSTGGTGVVPVTETCERFSQGRGPRPVGASSTPASHGDLSGMQIPGTPGPTGCDPKAGPSAAF